MSTSRSPSTTPQEPDQPEIPEDEQWRIINESGLLKRLAPSPPKADVDPVSFSDEIFNAVILIIPFCSLYLMMDILAQQQYSQVPTLSGELGKMVEAVPIISVFIFYTNRYKSRRWLQGCLAAISAASGMRLFWVVNRSNHLVMIRQSPPLGVVWIYTAIQLQLVPLVICLACVAAFVKWCNLKLVF